MRKSTILAILLTLAVTPAFAQRASDIMGGDLGQAYGNSLNSKFEHEMAVSAMLADPAELERYFSAEQVEAFFDQAVVKVSFYPDGSWVAWARQGGEVAALRLGRKKIEIGGGAWTSGDWRLRAGDFVVPKRSQPVSLTLAAQGNSVAVDCLNRYEHADETVTFYVGPMNGLMCIGFVDAEATPFAEVMRTADPAGVAAAPGS